jgi:uncharacterized membrane protein required for colicin V production
MNFDTIVCVLLLISIASGIHKGLSRTGFGLLAVIVAFLTAAWMYPENIKGFLVVFVGVVTAAGIAGCALSKFFRATENKWLDQLLGGLFGFVNGVLFWVLAVVALMAFGPQAPRDAAAHSRFAPFALEATQAVAEILPDEMKVRIEQSYVELRQAIPHKYNRPLPPLPRAEI